MKKNQSSQHGFTIKTLKKPQTRPPQLYSISKKLIQRLAPQLRQTKYMTFKSIANGCTHSTEYWGGRKKSPVEQRVLPGPMEVLGKEGNQLNKASCDLKGTNNTLCSFK